MDRQAYTDWVRRAGHVLISLAVAPAAAASLLTVAVDTGTEMPMAGFQDGQLVAGFHKDLGEALADKMGRTVNFLPLPRKRIAMALEAGQADMVCLYLPPWLPGKFHWTRGFFPVAEVVVSSTAVPRPKTLRALSGQPIATVLGYYYPELETALGKQFVRDDGYSSSGNLRKMGAGRLHHAITQQDTLDYYLKVGEKLSLHPPLVIKRYQARCALSHKGRVRAAEVDQAINRMVKDGSVSKIINNYQSHLR